MRATGFAPYTFLFRMTQGMHCKNLQVSRTILKNFPMLNTGAFQAKSIGPARPSLHILLDLINVCQSTKFHSNRPFHYIFNDESLIEFWSLAR